MPHFRRPAVSASGDPKTFRMVMLTVIKKNHTTGRFILPNT